MPFVLFRCDGGPGIGMGHLMRCRALAFAFDERGWTSGFAVSRATAEWVKDLDTFIVPEGLDGAEAVNDILQRRGAECVVIDHYGLGAEFERKLTQSGILVVAIEDLLKRPHDVDVLFDANPGRVQADYAGYVPRRRTVLFLRSRYALLRPEFAKVRERGRFRTLRSRPKKLLIALGGADPDNISAQVIEATPAFHAAGLATTLIVGEANPHLSGLTQRCKELGVRMLRNPRELVTLMAGADIAVSGAGTMCYEFACLGVPTVALIVADNQRDVAHAIGGIGAATVVDGGAAFEPRHLVEAVMAIVSDKVLRERMSAAGQAMVSGDGARRCVEDTLSEIANMKRKQWVRHQDF